MLDYKDFRQLCKHLQIPVAKRHRVEGNTVAMAQHICYWLCYRSLEAKGLANYSKAGHFCDEAMASASDADCDVWLVSAIADLPEVIINVSRHEKQAPQAQDRTYAELIKLYEALTGKPYSRYTTKAWLIEQITELETLRYG